VKLTAATQLSRCELAMTPAITSTLCPKLRVNSTTAWRWPRAGCVHHRNEADFGTGEFTLEDVASPSPLPPASHGEAVFFQSCITCGAGSMRAE
jgi:hypothetical protein